jgi:hypothetical protein
VPDQVAQPEPDYLTVEGLPPLDGRYAFQVIDMMSIGLAGSLTNREAHELKRLSGVRIGELEDALAAGDNDVLVAFAVLILRRHGKRFDEDKLWDAQVGAALKYDFAHSREEKTEDPPEETPLEPSGPPASPENESSRSGGESSSPSSESPENLQSPIGLLGLAK